MPVEVGSAYVSIIPSFKGFGRELSRQLNAETRSAGTAAGATISRNVSGGLKSAGKSTSDFGKSLTRNVSLPIGGLGALAFKSFGDFDQTMRQVGVTTEISGAQLDQMRKLALKMGADTAFSAGDAAKAMNELAKGGLTAAQIKGGALAETLTLASAGGIGLEDASSTLANTMNTFGISAKNANVVTAALAGGASASTASIGSLSQALSQVGPGAKLMGLTVNDTVAALAAFDSAGIKGSDAGTSLKTMLSRLQPTTDAAATALEDIGLAGFSSTKALAYLKSKGVAPLGTSADVLRKQVYKTNAQINGLKPGSAKADKSFQKLASSNKILGTAFFDAAGNAKPLDQIAQSLQTGLKGLTKEQKASTLQTIFGSDASRAAGVLASEGAKGIGKMKAATFDLSKAQQLAKTNTDGAKGSMEQLRGSVETAGIQIGTILAPTLTDLAKSLTTLINKFGTLSPATQKNIIVAAGLAAALGPVAVAVGKVATGIGETIDAAKKVGSGLQTARTGIIGFGQGLRAGQSGLSAFSGRAQTFGSLLNRGFGAAFTAVRGPILAAATAVRAFGVAILTNPIGIAIVAIVALVAIGVLLYKKWTPFRTFIDSLWASMKVLAGVVGAALVTAFHAVVGAAQAVWPIIQSLAVTVGGALVTAFHAVVGAAQAVWAAIQTGIAVFQRIYKVVAPIVLSIVNVITQPLQGIIGFIRGLFEIIKGVFTGNLSLIGTGVSRAIGGIVRFFFGMPARVLRAVIPLLPGILRFMGRTFVSLGSAVLRGIVVVVRFFATLPSKVLRAVLSLLASIVRFMVRTFALLGSAVLRGVVAVQRFFATLPGRALSAISSLAGRLLSWARNALNAMRSGVTSGANAVLSYFRALPARLLSGVSSLGSRLLSLGHSALTSMHSGVTSGASAVVSFMSSLPGKILSGLGNLGSTLVSAGSDVISGLISGIQGSAGRLIATIQDTVTNKLPGFVKKALGIASPSTVFAAIGRHTVEGLRKGILTSAPAAVEAARKLALAITDATNRTLTTNQSAQKRNAAAIVSNARAIAVNLSAIHRKGVTASRRAELIRQRNVLFGKKRALLSTRDALKRQRAAIAANGAAAVAAVTAAQAKLAPKLAARDAISAQISAQTANIEALQAAKEKVRTALLETLDKSRDLFGGALEGVLPNPQAVADRLKENLAKIQGFAETLRTLTAKGFGLDIIQQVAAQGVEGGTKMADVLAQSTPAQVAEINKQYEAIGAASVNVSNDIAGRMYDSGIAAANGLLAGLVAKKAQLEAAMVSLADALVAAIQKRLLIRSPSKVFAGVGDNIGAGLEVGMDARQSSVHKSLESLIPTSSKGLERTFATHASSSAPNVRVFIGARELTDIVRTEVDYEQHDMARQLTYGRRA